MKELPAAILALKPIGFRVEASYHLGSYPQLLACCFFTEGQAFA